MDTSTADLILTIGVKCILVVTLLFLMMMEMPPTADLYPTNAIRSWVRRQGAATRNAAAAAAS